MQFSVYILIENKEPFFEYSEVIIIGKEWSNPIKYLIICKR